VEKRRTPQTRRACRRTVPDFDRVAAAGGRLPAESAVRACGLRPLQCRSSMACDQITEVEPMKVVWIRTPRWMRGILKKLMG